jgi:excisionase family DNA binding protein
MLVDKSWLVSRLGLKPGTIDMLVHRGQIPFVRLGKRIVRFDPAEIEKWVDSGRMKPKAECR